MVQVQVKTTEHYSLQRLYDKYRDICLRSNEYDDDDKQIFNILYAWYNGFDCESTTVARLKKYGLIKSDEIKLTVVNFERKDWRA